MPSTRIAGRTIDINDEGFLTEYHPMGRGAGRPAGQATSAIDMSDRHWEAILKFLRARISPPARARPRPCAGWPAAGGFDMKQLFELFPKKPAKKMAYVAGLPKPKGCV
jgi:TusE/DsrC/DsvC family sulfur relay protein